MGLRSKQSFYNYFLLLGYIKNTERLFKLTFNLYNLEIMKMGLNLHLVDIFEESSALQSTPSRHFYCL